MIEQVFLYGSMIYGTVSFGLYIIQRFDKAEWVIHKKERILLFICSVINSLVICYVTFDEVNTKVNGKVNEEVNKIATGDKLSTILLCIVAGCLLFACFTDVRACEVFQFTWWIAGVAAGSFWHQSFIPDNGFLYFANCYGRQHLLSLVFYLLLQEWFFCRMYGRADCHAFVICAVLESALGMKLSGYLCHMLIAFVGLAIMQVFCHNINQKGNLKRPVAFLPYITVSFWLMILLAFLSKK